MCKENHNSDYKELVKAIIANPQADDLWIFLADCIDDKGNEYEYEYAQELKGVKLEKSSASDTIRDYIGISGRRIGYDTLLMCKKIDNKIKLAASKRELNKNDEVGDGSIEYLVSNFSGELKKGIDAILNGRAIYMIDYLKELNGLIKMLGLQDWDELGMILNVIEEPSWFSMYNDQVKEVIDNLINTDNYLSTFMNSTHGKSISHLSYFGKIEYGITQGRNVIFRIARNSKDTLTWLFSNRTNNNNKLFKENGTSRLCCIDSNYADRFWGESVAEWR